MHLYRSAKADLNDIRSKRTRSDNSRRKQNGGLVSNSHPEWRNSFDSENRSFTYDSEPNRYLNSKLNSTVNDLRNSIDTQNPSKFTFKRDYYLTQKTEYGLWFDRLKYKLSANDLLDVIDSSAIVREYTLNERAEREKLGCVNCLDDFYHKQVLNMKDQKRIIQHLTDERRIKANVTSHC